MTHHPSPYINKEKRTIEFYIQNDVAGQVSLAGSFNHWAQDVLLFEPIKNGGWELELPMLNKGRHLYKFLIDSRSWVEDIDNTYREPDGFNGFSSVLFIQN
jgi:1,4-alpha-glucan branching enzyme